MFNIYVGICPKILQLLNILQCKQTSGKVNLLSFKFIALYNKRKAYNFVMPVMLLKFGKFEPSPSKSLTLLHGVTPSITISSSKKKKKNLKVKN